MIYNGSMPELCTTYDTQIYSNQGHEFQQIFPILLLYVKRLGKHLTAIVATLLQSEGCQYLANIGSKFKYSPTIE